MAVKFIERFNLGFHQGFQDVMGRLPSKESLRRHLPDSPRAAAKAAAREALERFSPTSFLNVMRRRSNPDCTQVVNNPHFQTVQAARDQTDAATQACAKIIFKKVELTKDRGILDQMHRKDLRGSIALTEDRRHVGWLHKLIYGFEWANAFCTKKSREKVNLCHGEVILGINDGAVKPEKKGELLLAHVVFNGLKTTSENHQKDNVITSIHVYCPVDIRIQALFAKHAEQTAVDFRQIKLDRNSKEFKKWVKKEVAQFSYKAILASIFHRQVEKPYAKYQWQAALAAADLLKGDKFRDGKGAVLSHFCTGYLTLLMQGTALVAALSEEEKGAFAGQSRERIAKDLFDRMRNQDNPLDRVSATYKDNAFMRFDANYTMSYFLGETLDMASVPAGQPAQSWLPV